jgi:adenosylcobinamide-GDP ribazoletransferase
MGMRRQLLLFLCAVQFLTRMPGIRFAQFEAAWMARSTIYFPLVGQIVGALSGAVLIGAAAVWRGAVPATLAVALAAILTGALHEDGLADVADGFAGGRDPAQRLAIMKDSRVGTYGALALILSTLLKIAALSTMPPHRGLWVLIAAHGAARAAAVVVMAALPYAADAARAKTEINLHRLRAADVAVALLIAAWPFLFLPRPAVAAALALGALLTILIGLAARALIGGQTGDVLGAVEQMCEIGILLGGAMVLGEGI